MLKSSKGGLACPICQQVFLRYMYLEIHTRTHTGERPFECSTCDKTFSSKCGLDQHKLTHSERLRPFPCKLCKKSFQSNYNYNRHQLVHTKEKLFGCNICQARFTLHHGLRSHIIRMHENRKQYLDKFECIFCSKSFQSSLNFEEHLRSHTQEKPYFCRTCCHESGTSRVLKKHNQIHTLDRDTPFQCDVCKRRFYTNNQLKDHLTSHSAVRAFQCGICKKDFRTRRLLCQHAYIHAKKKPHSCRICQKEFAQRGNLDDHMRSHTGERPFNCDACQRSFSTSSIRNRHILKIHKKFSAAQS